MDSKIIIGQNTQIIGFMEHFQRKYRTNSFFTQIQDNESKYRIYRTPCAPCTLPAYKSASRTETESKQSMPPCTHHMSTMAAGFDRKGGEKSLKCRPKILCKTSIPYTTKVYIQKSILFLCLYTLRIPYSSFTIFAECFLANIFTTR